jgi:hypothetical protein
MANTFAIFGDYIIKNNTMKLGFKKWDITGATAAVDLGTPSKGVTLTRVVALGVFSLAAKKNKSKLYITVELADGQTVVIEGPAQKEKQARQFAAAVKQAA